MTERCDLLLVKTAKNNDISLDYLSELVSGLDEKAIAILCGNVSTLSKKRKSRVVP